MPRSAFMVARTRVSLLAVSALGFGCQGADRLSNDPDDLTDVPADPEAVAFLNSSTGGIPFGFFHMPSSEYGATYTGALRAISPALPLADLDAARNAGANVIISLVGPSTKWVNADGSFSLDKWKGRLEPFRGVDFSSYIADGTIIGHYMIDEPNDPANWGGTTVSPATLDEMALYSKRIWPTMPTIVRVSPSYLKGFAYQYLDAAWAQYHDRFGAVIPWLDKYVQDANLTGLALIMGMNVLAGGNSTTGLPGYYSSLYSMNAAQLESVGSAMLDDPYPCAFVSWKYQADYLSRSDIQSALVSLATKARARPFKDCRGAAQGTEPPPPLPPSSYQPPTAAFDPPSCTAGVPCQFNDASFVTDGTIAFWRWTFGDGGSSALKDPKPTYVTANTYTVTLTVTDDKGGATSVSKGLTVTPASPSNQLPTAAFNPPSCTVLACQFTDGSSDDKGVTSWSWNFGDPASGGTNTSTTQSPGHTFSAAGTYTVTLTVGDAEGATSTTTNTVTATSPNQAPTAAFTSSCTALTCQFTDGSSDDKGVTSWSWNFGDPASGVNNTSAAQSPGHSFSAAGTYAATLTVTDNVGAISTISRNLTVAPKPPVPGVTPIVLKVRGWVDATRQYMGLTWGGMVGTTTSVYRDGKLITNTLNDGKYTNSRSYLKPITYVYKVCRLGTSTCSNSASVTFK